MNWVQLDAQQKQILRDALIEFISRRTGFPSDAQLLRGRAAHYVAERYPEQSAAWQARKIEEVLERCARAHALLDGAQSS